MTATTHNHPVWAILFPWFTVFLGLVAYYGITRSLPHLPYTVAMFIIGIAMGAGSTLSDWGDHISNSVNMWTHIDAEVLLLVFLPGLVFRDSYNLNVYQFLVGLPQSLVLAFPAVLTGTLLTSLIAHYLFKWDWFLSLTFGSIMSATDPVAIAALLAEVGAPQRLSILVSSESLLNDGAAIVFFTIFKNIWLFDLGIDGGQTYTWGSGIITFFKMSVGGAAIGFGMSLFLLLVLFLLNRRLNIEENAVNVASTVTFAYLTYYLAEVYWHTSGVISVVALGISTKSFGFFFINDTKMLDNFWLILEYLLNTILFCLAGCEWGKIVVGTSDREGMITGRDWVYLVILYLLLNVIRFALVFLCYPLISRIGLKTNISESIFMGFAGLRGAIGIALAINLDSIVLNNYADIYHLELTTKLFFFVGGIAAMTLLINAPLGGPLLAKLGLTQATDTRKKLVKEVEHMISLRLLDYFVEVAMEPRFIGFDFLLVQDYVPMVKEWTKEEISIGVKNYKNKHHNEFSNNVDKLNNFLSNFGMDPLGEEGEEGDQKKGSSWNLVRARVKAKSCMEWIKDVTHDGEEKENHFFDLTLQLPKKGRRRRAVSMVLQDMTSKTELRKVFVEMLRSAYNKTILDAGINRKDGLVTISIFQSLEHASDSVNKGQPLNDWEAIQKMKSPFRNNLRSKISIVTSKLSFFTKFAAERAINTQYVSVSMLELNYDVKCAIALIEAHLIAERDLMETLGGKDFSGPGKAVIAESKEQTRLAYDSIKKYPIESVETILSHLLVEVLLHKASTIAEEFLSDGLLKETETHDYLHHLQDYIENKPNVLKTQEIKQESSA